jgi:hypothetical protein
MVRALQGSVVRILAHLDEFLIQGSAFLPEVFCVVYEYLKTDLP